MPQSADMHVDAAIECRRGPSPREVEQLVARQNVARSFDESEQQIEFGGAQIDQRACRRVDWRRVTSRRQPANSNTRPVPAAEPGAGMADRRNTARMRASSSRMLNGFAR